MSPSTYLIAVPIGLVALSSWLVKVEDESFAKSRRNADIQQAARHIPGPPLPDDATGNAPLQRLDHGRYGWKADEMTGASSTLGDDVPRRQLGSRPPAAASWLEQQTEGRPVVPLPEIPGYIPSSGLDAGPFETVPAGAGFHITSDEATKLDMTAEKVVFNGNVKMTCPQFHLAASQLVVHLGKDKKSFKLAEATGAVQVQLTGVPDEKKYRGQSSRAVYDPGKGTLIMTGWPRIQGQGQELIAAEESTKVTLFPENGRMVTEGRAQTRVARQLMAEGARHSPDHPAIPTPAGR